MRISKEFCLASFALIVICFSSIHLYSQTPAGKIDSLEQLIKNSKTDSDKIKSLIMLSQVTACSDTLHKIRYANEALQLAEDVKWENGVFNASANLASIYEGCIKNYIYSIKYYTQAISISKTLDDKLNEAEAIHGMANAYKSLSQYSKALDCYREVLALKPGPDIDIAALGNMGVVYQDIGDYPNALACYDNSLKELDASLRISKNIDFRDTLQMAGLLFTIGDIYVAMLQYDKALGNYNNALELFKQINNKTYSLFALMAIGKVYQNKKDDAKAIEYYNMALGSCKELKNLQSETNVYNQLGDAYIEQGNADKAMEYAQMAQQLVEENSYYDLMPATYTTLGKIYTAQKKYAMAVDYLQKAVAICGKSCSLISEKDAWEELSKTYEQMGKPALSLDAYKHFISIRDTVYNIGKANELIRTDLQSGYERKQITDSLKQAGDYGLKMQKQRVYTMSGYAGFVMVLLLSFFIYRNYNQQKRANIAISKASEAVKTEKQVSENLLLNILPEDVAKELKTKGTVDAKLFDHVTVLFTDFINFTSAAERFTPQELVAELHTCFKAFDQIIRKYDIEKIKTVGDAYMAASGLPQPNASHGSEMIKAALEIRNYMQERNRQLGDKTFGIRIGINSGTVVAGIVGVTKFAYDIWGDTVNIAARMEQYGMEGKINISQSTYELVKDEFTCTDRGEIDAKHKGKMRMYFVETSDSSS